MTNLQIEYFIKVAENMSFSETAQIMYVSQAAVSRQIAALETELGIKLFYRKYRRLSLTPAGEIMLDLFIRQLNEFDFTLKEARCNQDSDKLSLKIGLLEGIDIESIYHAVREFERLNNNHNINISIDSISSLIEGINDSSYDIAFTFHHNLATSRYIEAIPVLPTRILFYMSKNHPLATKADLCLSDLVNETFVAPIVDTSFVRKEYTNNLYNACGFMPRKLICKPNLDSVIVEVRFNNCIAMLYDITLVALENNFHILKSDTYNHISLLYSKANKNPLISKLIRYLTDSQNINVSRGTLSR